MFLVRSKVPGKVFLLLPPLVKNTKKDWIKNSWKDVYGKYKKGDKKIVPDCWNAAVQWETNWILRKRCVDSHLLGQSPGGPRGPGKSQPNACGNQTTLSAKPLSRPLLPVPLVLFLFFV